MNHSILWKVTESYVYNNFTDDKIIIKPVF